MVDDKLHIISYAVEFQWLEHLWYHGNLFETWVVRTGSIMVRGQEANGNNLGTSFRSSIRQWYVECTH